jgi:hypothetical protein
MKYGMPLHRAKAEQMQAMKKGGELMRQSFVFRRFKKILSPRSTPRKISWISRKTRLARLEGAEKKDLSTSGLLASADSEVRTLTVDSKPSKTPTQGLTREAAAAGIGVYSEETMSNNSFKLYHDL